MTEYKQVIVVRKDLKLSKGKLAVQACHASLGVYQIAVKKYAWETKAWLSQGGKKAIVYVNSRATLLRLKDRIPKKIPSYVVYDAGKTHLKPGTLTCIGLGPFDSEVLDRYTGKLKLVG